MRETGALPLAAQLLDVEVRVNELVGVSNETTEAMDGLVGIVKAMSGAIREMQARLGIDPKESK